MRLQSAQTPCGNLCVLETFQSYRAPATAVNPLRSQDFHLFSTVRGVSIQDFRSKDWIQARLENSFTARPKTRFHFDSPQNPAQAEAEDDSKIKDRWEALLFAETLQGTLSPNANPGKGSVGGLLNWMPKAAARIQRAAQTLLHLSSARSFIPNCMGLRKGGIKKVICSAQRRVGGLQPFGHSFRCCLPRLASGFGKVLQFSRTGVSAPHEPSSL